MNGRIRHVRWGAGSATGPAHLKAGPAVLPYSLQKLFTETFTYGVVSPQLRVRETRWQRVLVDCLDTLVPCPNEQCSLNPNPPKDGV